MRREGHNSSESDASATKRTGDELAERVYAELRRIAQKMLAEERIDHTFSATALVHEAYLRVLDQDGIQWNGTGHYRAIASSMMSRVLIDYARSRNSKKHGGQRRHISRVEEEPLLASTPEPPDAVTTQVDEALEKLRALDERQFFIVQLRVHGGFSAKQTAATLGLSLRTVEREWAMAKAWLKRELQQGETL